MRLRLDRISGKHLLLRPEKGFELQGSSLEIVRLCDGAQTVDAIIDQLAAAYPDVSRAQIAEDVQRLLGQLAERGLIELSVEMEEGGA
ncbi:MAG TPA: pyrroloquinoline quinone biosynthesis peptide chaperone PqqD [Polyangia bacterium]|nr:pyrroloquinoline quinone biosynthesis peptide chaperone PqqD [Polyangia bacterium]